jgi:ABC-type uncharacterized transport system permease subunit
VAAALYSIGLLHAILMLVRRREQLFRVAFPAFALGSVFHFVSIMEEGIVNNRCPISNFYETLSMCAFLVAIVYLGVQLRYKLESLSVFIFPLVFVMSLVATFGNPVTALDSPIIKSVWLSTHIVLILLGYAALAFTGVASLLYLFQERELKSKRPGRLYQRLPALGTLDELISKFMGIGFVLITLGVIAASTWASMSLRADWMRQPEIAISFLTWGAYLGMICLRVTAGWRGRKAAIMSVTVIGFAAITWAAHARLGDLLFKQ